MVAYKNPIPSVAFSEKSKEHKGVEFIENDYNAKESVYFAFIDVLGFKKVFDDNRQNNNNLKNDKFAEKFKEVFKYYFTLMGSANFADVEKCYAGQTSDSLYFYTESEVILIEFLKIFSHFNAYAMTQDVFFRGGIAKGNLFYNQSHQFYGESVIYAYLLESEISKNPIVIIDENTYNAMELSPERSSLVKEQNGRYYLRPFSYLKNRFDLDIKNPSIKVREINPKQVRERIEENKAKFEYDGKNYEKYVFLLKEYIEEYIG